MIRALLGTEGHPAVVVIGLTKQDCALLMNGQNIVSRRPQRENGDLDIILMVGETETDIVESLQAVALADVTEEAREQCRRWSEDPIGQDTLEWYNPEVYGKWTSGK